MCVAVGCVWLLAVCGLTGSGWRLGCVPHTVRAIQRNRAFEFLKHDIVTAQPKAAILYDTGPVCGLVHASGDPHTTTRVCRQRGKHRQRSGWQKQACCECACYHQLLLGQVASRHRCGVTPNSSWALRHSEAIAQQKKERPVTLYVAPVLRHALQLGPWCRCRLLGGLAAGLVRDTAHILGQVAVGRHLLVRWDGPRGCVQA